MKNEDLIQEELESALRHYRLFTAKSFPRFLWHSFRESKLYRRIHRFWVNFRRYRLISRIVTVVATILTLMGTGAAIFLFSLITILLLPVTALLAGGTMLLGWFGRGRQNEALREEVIGRTVYLFFPSALRSPSFSAHTMHLFAQQPQSAVFIISPYAWSGVGLGGHGFYINARREAEHLFLLRRHYFFFFRKLLAECKAQRTVVIL